MTDTTMLADSILDDTKSSVPEEDQTAEVNSRVLRPRPNEGVAVAEDEINVLEDRLLPSAVEATEEMEDEEDQRKKKKNKSGNFILKCIGEDVSDDANTASVYHFKICLENQDNERNKNRESIVYDVEISQDDFGGALKKWTKQIKTGLLYCRGGNWQFAEKIQQAILKYEAREADDEEEQNVHKEKLRMEKEGITQINDKTYFISGRKNVFLLSPEDTPYARKLLDKEIEDLPVRLIYTGKETDYDCDPPKAVKELLEIISLFNANQRPHNQTSFVYGILQNLKAELYKEIDDHRVLVIYSKTTNSGKTVLMEICDILFNGSKSSGLSSGCTEAGLRNTLGEGIVGRFDEIDTKDIGAVTKLQKGIWPPGGGQIHMANEIIRVQTNLVITTNLYPDEVQKVWKLSHPDLTKYDFNHLGEAPMEIVSDEFQQNLDNCIKIAIRLHKQKPFLLGLGLSVLNKRPTGAEINEYDDLVGVRSSRFTQGIVQLVKFCKALEDLASDNLLDDEIPDSLSNPSFACILKGKNLVARQSERRPMDLISDISKNVDEARKCLKVTTKQRQGIVVWTQKLKSSSLYKLWMRDILSKLDDFDSTEEGDRVRGKLVYAEDLGDLYEFVVDLITITVERSLIAKAKDHHKNMRKALAHLRGDIRKFCTSDNVQDENIGNSGKRKNVDGGLEDAIQMMGPLVVQEKNLISAKRAKFSPISDPFLSSKSVQKTGQDIDSSGNESMDDSILGNMSCEEEHHKVGEDVDTGENTGDETSQTSSGSYKAINDCSINDENLSPQTVFQQYMVREGLYFKCKVCKSAKSKWKTAGGASKHIDKQHSG